MNQNSVSTKKIEYLIGSILRLRPLLRSDGHVSYSLHVGLSMGMGEIIGQRLTAPPHSHCMELNERYGGSLVPFLLVLF